MQGIRAVVLAAGKGTRMKSERPKVLHEVCGRPMLWYVLRSLRDAGIRDVLVVTSEDLREHLTQFDVTDVVQSEPLGTGHATKVALKALEPHKNGRILVASGDMPLVSGNIFRAVVASLDDESAAMALVTVKMPLPSNFGRVVRRGSQIERIVEVRDASPDELAIEEMNAGIYAVDETALRESVDRIENVNAQKEYYLTDAIADLVRRGRRVQSVPCANHLDVLGINDRAELAVARKEMNARLCARHMRDGVTILDPDTTYLEPELTIGRDTVIYPNTAIGLLSEIGESCAVGPNSRLSNARLGARVSVRESVIVDSTLGDDCGVGPFAHLRGETILEPNVRIGNFVEIKKSRLRSGVKAGHLSYLGDADIGEETNIGAGTITCNYDGEKKNATVIGSNVSIGSNSSLVAPLSIGDGALTGAGSVVTHDVSAGERVAGNPARPLSAKRVAAAEDGEKEA
jgi:bifunctional UDP-N-acetylglucosamine pyrophosphorylase / glucosamine-1-phosphate N-acetyltransferase